MTAEELHEKVQAEFCLLEEKRQDAALDVKGCAERSWARLEELFEAYRKGVTDGSRPNESIRNFFSRLCVAAGFVSAADPGPENLDALIRHVEHISKQSALKYETDQAGADARQLVKDICNAVGFCSDPLDEPRSIFNLRQHIADLVKRANRPAHSESSVLIARLHAELADAKRERDEYRQTYRKQVEKLHADLAAAKDRERVHHERAAELSSALAKQAAENAKLRTAILDLCKTR